MGVDYDFIQTLGLDLKEGRAFSADVAGDARNAFIINESAASALGWTDPLGRPFALNGRDGTVIGVVKDFHTASLREPVVPTVLQVMSIRAMPFVSIRLAGDRIDETLASIEKTWGEFAPGWPFEYAFLDAEVDAMYRSDRRLGDIVEIAAAVAIVIACLGLFGLAAYQVERRRKEIGIRKVHGASTARICRLLSAGALLPVLGATALSGPIVYIAMNTWLQAFAYRITIGPGFILLAGCTAVVIAAATVAAQTLRAARANPIVSLRYE
jgi:putative ABC transport system permease protein